jgi:hypothetical protein
MKQIIILLCLISVACLAYAAQKNKVTYEFPEAMPEHVKAEYAKQCDKGSILYEINCARCHNTTVKRKTVIPDFTPEQLIGYELRVKNAQHETNMPETTVTAEELGLITTFLTYKRKNK